MWISAVLSICLINLNALQCYDRLHERIPTFGNNEETYPKISFSIQNPVDGSYYFSYDTGFSHYQSFREERRDSSGEVTGMFGYVEPEGVLRVTYYVANRYGYRATTATRYLVRNDVYSVVGPIPFPTTRPEKKILHQPNQCFTQQYNFNT